MTLEIKQEIISAVSIEWGRITNPTDLGAIQAMVWTLSILNAIRTANITAISGAMAETIAVHGGKLDEHLTIMSQAVGQHGETLLAQACQVVRDNLLEVAGKYGAVMNAEAATLKRMQAEADFKNGHFSAADALAMARVLN